LLIVQCYFIVATLAYTHTYGTLSICQRTHYIKALSLAEVKDKH